MSLQPVENIMKINSEHKIVVSNLNYLMKHKVSELLRCVDSRAGDRIFL